MKLKSFNESMNSKLPFLTLRWQYVINSVNFWFDRDHWNTQSSSKMVNKSSSNW